MIEFDPELGFWNKFVFWYVAINAIACAFFTVVVVIGGFFDLRFLFSSLKEETLDETDDGRVVAEPVADE